MLGTHGAWRRVVPAAVVGVVAGCGVGVSQLPSAPPSVAATPTPSAASAASEDLERLRALGYLDYSEEAPSAAGGGVVSLDRERVQPGYTLVVYAGACACDLITITGEVVRSWSDQPCRRWEQARLLGDGSLLVVASDSDQDEPVNQQMEGRSLLKLGWDGSVLWRRRLNVHHDVQVLPDGRLLTLLMERRLIPGIDPSVESVCYTQSRYQYQSLARSSTLATTSTPTAPVTRSACATTCWPRRTATAWASCTSARPARPS